MASRSTSSTDRCVTSRFDLERHLDADLRQGSEMGGENNADHVHLALSSLPGSHITQWGVHGYFFGRDSGGTRPAAR